MDTARVFIARNRLNLAFGLGGFASAILGTLFGLFNVILFTNVVKLRPSYFYTGHILYGLWNAVNDPAFGWLLDRTANKSNRRYRSFTLGGQPGACASCLLGTHGRTTAIPTWHSPIFCSQCFVTMGF